MARALVLRHHLEDRPGLIGEAFEVRGFGLDVVTMDEMTTPPSLEAYDVVVILGSSLAVYDVLDTAWFTRELDLLDRADALAIPVLGICFGAQALCYRYGGRVCRAPEGEVGWHEIDVVDGIGLSKGPWFQFHFDRCSLPGAAELWATSSRAVQAFAVGRNVGVQFHPEIEDSQLKDWLAADEAARAVVADAAALIEQTAAETPAARGRAQELVDLFLSRVG